MFALTAKANGHELKDAGPKRKPKEKPKMGFDNMANFIGAM